MKPHFKDYFNPFEYWFVDLEKCEVHGRHSQYSLSTFVYNIHQGYRLLEPAEISKFDELLRESCLNYQY